MWSAAGVSLLIAAAALAIQSYRPSVLARLLGHNWLPPGLLAALVVVGATWQWWITRAAPAAPASAAPDKARQNKQSR